MFLVLSAFFVNCQQNCGRTVKCQHKTFRDNGSCRWILRQSGPKSRSLGRNVKKSFFRLWLLKKKYSIYFKPTLKCPSLYHKMHKLFSWSMTFNFTQPWQIKQVFDIRNNKLKPKAYMHIHTTQVNVCTGMLWPVYIVLFSTSLGNSGLCWTVFVRNRDTAVPAEGNGD